MAATEDSAFDEYRDRVERPLGRLFREYGASEWPYFAAGMVANVVARVASLLPPVVLGAAIDSVFTGNAPFDLPLVPAAWFPTEEVAVFELSVVLIAGSFLVTAVFTYAYGVTANLFAHRVMHDVRTDSFAKMQGLDMTFFDDKQTGEVMSVLNNDASNLEVFLDDALQNSARLVVMVAGITAILVAENWQLAVVTLSAIPLMVALTSWFMKRAEPRYERQRAAVGNLNTKLENSLAGVELVKTNAAEAHETDRVTDASYRFFRDTMDVLRLSYVYRPGMELLAGLSFAVTFAVGGYWLLYGPPLFLSGSLSPGAFVTFIFLTQRFVTPLAEVSNIVDQYENARASSARVFGLMDVPSAVTEAEEAVELTDVEGRVEYDDVTFSYDAEETVIDDVSFDADPGDTVALVGPTGAGKSTLCKLLLRLYDVDEGAVRVDGHDVRDLTLASLREHVGYVSQDTFLFDGTIAENIAYGQFDADREAVVEATKAADAHEFVVDLPEGYDTEVGERGVKLSGGQRQRIDIARAILKDPEILVFDEATSDVDTETERRIQASLDDLSADRTALVIAHRLSTVRDADAILVVEDGEITERGTHDDLLDRGGRYADLWNVQTTTLDE
ncbi:ABC-type transport system ATP-binding/permease protein [Halobacterium hubeiense]|uniref:ABC-type transport system ATP-binding/permease protein n=1 Tax=Halobacterium hubeiense TaxID=1407499 RepID=A0A0U5GX03_9EURY|nr:ABC transporter ATP-binding protein [Halobacterium hubeiense]CQH44798.1 ABC-type transport system ATP-binding/permease protein [Halobacterium hubeiense]